MNARNFIFVDLETTGLDEDQHEIIEIGWRLVGPDARTIFRERQAKIYPMYPERITPHTREVNGFSEETWRKEAVSLKDELQIFLAHSYEAILSGQGLHFEEKFLRKAMKEMDLQPNWHYQHADTQKIAQPLYMLGKIKSPSLHDVAPYFGLSEQPKPHRALADAQLSHEVYLKFLDLFKKIT